MLSTKCSLPSLHRVKPKRIFAPSTFLPPSLTDTVQWFYMCVQPNTELALAALRFLRSTHSVPFFPFGGEWRLRSKRNLESTSCPAKSPDVGTKTNQLHLLIIRRKSERRRNLRILSKWKLRMKSTHPSQSRPPYTFTYVKKEYKNILPDSIVIIIATSIRCELQMLRNLFLSICLRHERDKTKACPVTALMMTIENIRKDISTLFSLFTLYYSTDNK